MSGVQAIASETVIRPLTQPQWFALQTRPRHEKRVAAELDEKRIDKYLPLITQVHRWSDRRKVVQLPLFPGYIFVHAQLEPIVRHSVQRISGVLTFVACQREPVSIPDSQIEDIRKLLSNKMFLTPYPFLKIGQRVRVRGGALDGLEGILVTNGQKRLVISVESIQRSLSIAIEGYDLEPA